MALTDTFVKNVKPTGAVAGDKHADGLGLYLHVKEAGKYWRMNYRFTGKQKTLALGVYPEVSLAKARKRREIAREQLAEGVDPGVAKREERQAKADAAARVWLTKTAAKRAEVTQSRITTLLEKDVFPFIGGMSISAIKPRDVLDKSVRKIEARGSIDTAHRAKQICGQIFRYAVAIGMAERDITTDLRGALEAIPESHFSAMTEPKQAGELLRSIFDYSGHPRGATGAKPQAAFDTRAAAVLRAHLVAQGEGGDLSAAVQVVAAGDRMESGRRACLDQSPDGRVNDHANTHTCYVINSF